MMFEPAGAQFHFYGRIGDRIRANQENWFQSTPTRSPRMLGILQERKTGPTPSQLLPWVGEYPGNISSAPSMPCASRAIPPARRYRPIRRGLIASQGDDGYLGPFRLINA